MAEKGAEIDAKLAEVDAFVESELGTIGPIIQAALTNTDTSKVDSCVDSALLEVESQINSELAMLDEFLESELAGTEELVESVIRNVESETIIIPDDVQIVNIESVETERDVLIESQLAMLESFVESTLEKSEALVESELEKVDALVESELAKVESVVESELAKVDLFIEKELEKTDAGVNAELSKMELLVEEELANIEKIMEEIADCVTASTETILTISNSDKTNEGQVRTAVIDGTFPVSGRTVIIGRTGCPPILPTCEPLPIYVESFPVFEADETYETEIVSEDSQYTRQDDGCVFEVPMKGEVDFSGLAHAVGSCKIQGASSCDSLLPLINSNMFPPTVGDASPIIPLKQASRPYNTQYFSTPENDEPKETEPVLYRKTHLPMVILSDRLRAGQPIILKGEVEFSGNADADGSASISAHFPCPPLTATEVGPDGKKYIWIAKKPCNKASCHLPNPKPKYPTYTADFPETVIMDAARNYQKHISGGLDVDFGSLGPLAPATV